MNYYNEIDTYVAQWLRNLIDAGLIPQGDVDARSIQEVTPNDLKGYTQCHFFAGIGGWSLALQLAGWPATRPVWTGSCPCQPFSSAGKGKGNKDERHLWPEFYRLIKVCKPITVFGEQVTGAIKHDWLNGISTDLEREDYAVGSVVLGAHSIGAPHIRQRLFWVANSSSAQCERSWQSIRPDAQYNPTRSGVSFNGMENCIGLGRGRGEFSISEGKTGKVETERPCGLGVSGIPDPSCTRDLRRPEEVEQAAWRPTGDNGGEFVITNNFWSDFDIIPFLDGKARRVKSGLTPLVTRIPGHVAQIRAIGNSIVPQVAAEFIKAYMEIF